MRDLLSPIGRAPAKSCEAENGQWSVIVAGCPAEGGGDVGVTGQAEGADGQVAQAGHDLGRSTGADLGAVLVVGDIADPVDSVLDLPVPPHQRAEPSRAGLGGRQAGDAVGGLLPDALAVQAAGVTADPEDLRGMGEVDPVAVGR